MKFHRVCWVVLALSWHSAVIYGVSIDLSLGYPGSEPSTYVWEISLYKHEGEKQSPLIQNKNIRFFLSLLCSGNVHCTLHPNEMTRPGQLEFSCKTWFHHHLLQEMLFSVPSALCYLYFCSYHSLFQLCICPSLTVDCGLPEGRTHVLSTFLSSISSLMPSTWTLEEWMDNKGTDELWGLKGTTNSNFWR